MTEKGEGDFEAELRVLVDLKRQITKAHINFKKSPKDRINEVYINTRLECLEELQREFRTKNEYIISHYENYMVEYSKLDVFESGYDVYLDYKTDLKLALSKIVSTSNPSKLADNGSSSKDCYVLRLPKITLPTFSGKYSEWSSFRDLFISLVHNNPKLDDVQRLHYLKTQVTGEAEQLIRYLPVTKNNYVKCWDLLQKRYNNKRFLSNCILKRLFSQKTVQSESSSALKELVDTTSDCLHELTNLGIDTKNWDVIIIYITCLKLDAETRKQWELQVNQSCEDLPSFEQFKEFVENRFRALEVVEPNKHNPSSKNNRVSNPKVLHATSNNNNATSVNNTCTLCTGDHKLHQCKQFCKEDVEKRRELAKSLNVCFNCLGNNHSVKQCRSTTKCLICHKSHHTLLHPKSANPVLTVAVTTESQQSESSIPESPSVVTETIPKINSHFLTGNVYNQTLLATALLKAESKNGQSQILRALIDPGSQASFISEAAVQLLHLNKIVARSTISGVGGDKSGLTSTHIVMVNIQSLHDSAFTMEVKAHVIRTITSILPENKFVMDEWPEINHIALADPQYNTPSKIDVLLGAEIYSKIIKEGLIKNASKSTVAQDTYLGWIISGTVGGSNSERQQCHHLILNAEGEFNEVDVLKRFWELESEPLQKDKILTPEEQACEDHFDATTFRDESGRYVVELPFRTADPPCKYGNSRDIAMKRLLSLEKRLSQDPNAKEQYSQVLDEYLSLGHMEKISDEPKEMRADKVWLPHHAVIRLERTTTKTRVVFNASSKGTNGVSLNDTLMVGPTLQPDLRHIVMRWRLHSICLTADIVKMYRQVRVAPNHVDFQRILWRKDTNAEIEDYRLLTVTFGTSCGPYLAVKALQQTAVDEGHMYTLAAKRVKTDFYMDDLMSGCETETEAIHIYHEMNEMLKKGGFILQKWSSNKMDLLDKLEGNTGKEKGKDLEIKVDEITKILGLTWNRRSDDFCYTLKMKLSAAPQTKREVIAEISRLYDPLGWVAPCIIIAKVFIQKLWIAGLDWDEKLPTELYQEWKRYRVELSSLEEFHIPRWLNSYKDNVAMELHGFSDASNVAYAAVIFIRIIDSRGVVHTNLVTAKTKVAPIKQVSIPRLELCGAVLVTKLLREVAGVLGINTRNLHAWTDSTVVLAWLCAHPSRWKTFVANRTSEILSLLETDQWSYVKSGDNPADCASRGMKASALVDNQLWLKGPKWLSNLTVHYSKPSSIHTKLDLEAKAVKTHVGRTMQVNIECWDKFSTLQRLVRVVSYCRRFLQLIVPKEKRVKTSPFLSSSEIQDALTCCIKLCQQKEYVDEIKALSKNQDVSKKSKLITLCPFLDKTGVLMVGGRITNALLPEKYKHPIIIPEKSHLAKLIVADAHMKTLHGGQQLMISFIRTRYWIPRLKNLVKAHVRRCARCVRNAATTVNQLMGQLPACRITPNKPFLNSGVDYAGPIKMRVSKGRGQRSYKGYICLFVCMVTRAVHIEAVSDLTSKGFLAAFKRFVARRGRCALLWSDNGTNFVGASKELKTLFSEEKSTMIGEVAEVLATNGTDWRFIPPNAPHFGGLWEAGIKSVKHHLKRVIGDSTLTFEEMATLLSQIEACLNSRPLSQASSDPNDPEPLTPGHFLVGEPLILVPDINVERDNICTLRRWHLTQRMVQSFWRRWSQEYITRFFQRYKWNSKSIEPKVGDVVLVREDNLPPTKWLYGLVMEVHPGKDNIVRVVTLRCKGTKFKRPTSKICILPSQEP